LAFAGACAMAQTQNLRGVGRLYRGQRNLGCVGYVMQITDGQIAFVKFDPIPDGAEGDVFSLHLADGRILECQAAENCRYFQPVGAGPHAERRVQRRPTAAARLLV
jgi:hypothetical protein